jgi:CzcA family heavy metal efflux pump
MKIGVTSAELGPIDLSLLARWNIRPRLMGVPGVANVAIWGQRNEMLFVNVDPARLAEKQVTLDEVMTASADALDAGLLKFTNGSSVGTGGHIETPNQRLPIRHIQPIENPDDLARITVLDVNGRPIRLDEVADVVVDHQPLIGDAVIDDGEGLMLIVEKLPWANTVDVTRGVDEALAALQPALPGVKVDAAIFRPATFIEMAIDNLSLALLVGCLLVVLVLAAFLFEWRSAVISLIAIPLSLVAAAVVLGLTGATINTMVVAGFVIAVGVVVDDAIIDVENIMRRLRQARLEQTGVSTARVILEASLEVRSSIIYATLIIVAALVPVFLMEGLSGSFFRPLATSYALAVFASMIVALTVTPALALLLLRRAPIERRKSPVVGWLQQGYDKLLGRILVRPRPAVAGVTFTVMVGLATLPALGQSLLPSFKERDFLMHWLTVPSASHPEMVRITTAASRELRSIPGVLNFGAHIGQAVAADEVVGMYFGENWISVDPAADYESTVDAIQEVVDGYPGLQRDVLTYLKERIREVLTGASEAVTVRIYGPELAELRDVADDVRRALARVDGLIDLHVQLQAEIPQIDIEVDLERAQVYGLKPGDVRRATAALMASEEVNDTYRNGKVFDVRIFGTDEVRNSLFSIQNILLDTPDGNQVRLAEIADVRIAPTPNVINREGSSRRIDVGANVRGRDLGAVTADVERALATVAFPSGYHPELIGEFQERQQAQAQLQLFAIAAAAAVLLLLYAAFGSGRLAVLTFVTLPSALVGGVLAAYLSGGVISLGSLVGFFTVLGIAARNGIMMINHFQHLERYEGETFGPGLVIRGARERLSPILMTALATGLAVVPLVIAGDQPGHEIEHPMAVVILGGLVTSTLLNLFLMPSLYLRFGRAKGLAAAIADLPR